MIQLININKKYKGQIIIDNLNLEIKKGEMIAIIGESGSGKSTVLNMIGLLEKPDNGTINIDEYKNIKANSKLARKLFKNKIGYIFQNFALIDDQTVEDNLKIAVKYAINNKATNKKIDDVLYEVGLSGAKKKYIFQLSGGEQQRVALARVILKSPDIVLCDEPTGSLDKKNRDIVLNILKKLNNEGKTIIIVTHDEFVANQTNRIIEIKKHKN